MSDPVFSVIIPCYNRSLTIQPTLLSVKNQTFENFECVVIDDGSDDPENLKATVESINDERFRVVRQENKGGGSARNTGIAVAKGKWLAFLDSDDFFVSNKLELCFDKLQSCDDNQILFSYIFVERDAGVRFLKPHRAPFKGERIDEYLMCDRGFIQTSTIVVSRKFAASVLFDANLPYSQDTDFCIRAWLAGGEFQMINEPLVIWSDKYSVSRVSSNQKIERVEQWVESLRGRISFKAYLGYRGWNIAKLYRNVSMFKALYICLCSIAYGCYRPKLAATVFLQVLLSRNAYRVISDFLIGKFKIGV